MEENVVFEWVKVTLRRDDGVKFLRAASKSAFVRIGGASELSFSEMMRVRVSFLARATRRTRSAGIYPSVFPAISSKSKLGERWNPSTGDEEDEPGLEDGFDGSIQELSDMLWLSL